jgi:hypothetical protein
MSIIYINPYQFGPAYDADAQDYINRVIAADVAAGDTSGLEVGVQDAINDFFVGCKADGNYAALKAACILAGARTQSGAMVPLVSTMPTPTMFGAVAGWNYNRKTGLAGNGTNNYLNSNRDSISDPQDDFHQAVYSSAPISGLSALIGTSGTGHGSHMFFNGLTCQFRNRHDTTASIANTSAAGFVGSSRSSSATYDYRANGTSSTALIASIPVPGSRNHFVFARNNGTSAEFLATQGISFYSIGESLDLALLDARVTTLMSDLAAAIP